MTMAMACFRDLPLDILPLLVANFDRPAHLESLCLVNRTFYVFAVPKLYERITIPSHPGQQSVKLRVELLFRTLAGHPNLARLVHRLDTKEIRNFPTYRYEQTMEWCIKSLENCVQLKSCTWTRNGSLKSVILSCLGKCQDLDDIAINGQHSGNYEPTDLIQLLHLRKISLIMPSKSVLEILPSWFQATGQSLMSLTLDCKENSNNIHVTDSLLESISQYLPQLEHLNLADCRRVTNSGVWSMIKNNVKSLKELGLKNLSPAFDMLALSEACSKAGGLTSLLSVTLTTFSIHPTHAWMNGIISLLERSPLEAFQVYASDFSQETLADRLCPRIVDQHRDHLVRFSFHQLRLSLDTIDYMCLNCNKLEQLFVVINYADMASLAPILAKATQLRTLHINMAERWLQFIPATFASDIVRRCNATICQIGIGATVWKVERRVSVVDGIAQVDRCLVEAENPDIPEHFLVIRT